MRSQPDPMMTVEPSPYVNISEVAAVLGMTRNDLKNLLERLLRTHGHAPDIASPYVRRSVLRAALLAGLEKSPEVLQAMEDRWVAAKLAQSRHVLPTGAQRARVIRRDGLRCRYCARRVNRNSLRLDHVYPRSRGGLTVDENLVVCCRDCNYKKGARTPIEAMMELLPVPEPQEKSAAVKKPELDGMNPPSLFDPVCLSDEAVTIVVEDIRV